MERRDFLKLSLSAGALALIQLSGFGCKRKAQSPTFELPGLPYEEHALEPYISRRTISLHYGAHHRGYVDKTNALVAGTPYQGMSLVEVITQTCGTGEHVDVFNNAAQAFNHTFYWNSMKPAGGKRPAGEISRRISEAFGRYETFYDAFIRAAMSQFGSGWVWLVLNDEGLEIVKTSNADTPVAHGVPPLLTLDVWEHAYYLDYQQRRADYVKAYLDYLVNWNFAEKNLKAAEVQRRAMSRFSAARQGLRASV